MCVTWKQWLCLTIRARPCYLYRRTYLSLVEAQTYLYNSIPNLITARGRGVTCKAIWPPLKDYYDVWVVRTLLWVIESAIIILHISVSNDSLSKRWICMHIITQSLIMCFTRLAPDKIRDQNLLHLSPRLLIRDCVAADAVTSLHFIHPPPALKSNNLHITLHWSLWNMFHLYQIFHY